jgi:hypothetical protein
LGKVVATEPMEGSMQHNVIAARTWSREFDAETVSTSMETASLFSLLGFVASVAVLLTTSSETVAAITAALAAM